MKIKVLGSGSKGNSTLIETASCNILIDAGLTLSTIEKRIDFVFPHIDILIITHIHIDHIKGIKSVIKKYNPIIITLSEELKNIISDDKIINKNSIEVDKTTINLFKLSHDVSCCGAIIKENNNEMVYITDTGYINKKVLDVIKEKDIYILESNHDNEMLRNSKYPFYLQQRIRGDKGHLSNTDCSKYLKKIIGNNTKYLVLAHLSEENNTEEIVKEEIGKMLKTTDNKIKKVYVAKQNESLETIEV